MQADEMLGGVIHARVITACTLRPDAVRSGTLEASPTDTLTTRAVAAIIISADEKTMIDAGEEARNDAIQVDWFDKEAYEALGG